MLPETEIHQVTQHDWKNPIALVQNPIVNPYPIDCLPNIILNAVTDYHQYGQQPIPLIACSALANMSLACQTLANVARDSMLVSPVSLYFLVCVSSGERKSAVDQAFGQAIRQWEIKQRDKQDAQKLSRWLSEKFITQTTPRYLQQYSPIRDKSRQMQAITLLIQHHHLKEEIENGKTVLLVNPYLQGLSE